MYKMHLRETNKSMKQYTNVILPPPPPPRYSHPCRYLQQYRLSIEKEGGKIIIYHYLVEFIFKLLNSIFTLLLPYNMYIAHI